MRSRSAVQLDVGYTHPQKEDPEPGRALRDRSCGEITREPSPAPARERPKKLKSGKHRRPRKLYRYVSTSSITSSRVSSRENLSQKKRKHQNKTTRKHQTMFSVQAPKKRFKEQKDHWKHHCSRKTNVLEITKTQQRSHPEKLKVILTRERSSWTQSLSKN